MTRSVDMENPTTANDVEKKDTSDSLQEISLEDSLVGKLEEMTKEIEEESVSEITEAEEEAPREQGVSGGYEEEPTQSASGEKTSLGGLLGNKEIEEAATLAATVTREAAAAAQEGLLKASNEAKSFFGALWSSFEAPNASGGEQEKEASASIDIRERFSIQNDSEKILESFRCKLIQQYVASNNSFTKPKSIGFSGMFHILDSHVVFEFDNISNGKPVVVSDEDIRDFLEEEAGVIVMTLRGSRTFVVGHFAYGSIELESAMNLLRRKLRKDST